MYIHIHISIYSKRNGVRGSSPAGHLWGETRRRNANSFIADCRITRARIHAEFGMHALLNSVLGANLTLSTSRVSYPPSYLDITVGGEHWPATSLPTAWFIVYMTLCYRSDYICMTRRRTWQFHQKYWRGWGREAEEKHALSDIIKIRIWVSLYIREKTCVHAIYNIWNIVIV